MIDIKKDEGIYEAIKHKAVIDLGRKMGKNLNLIGLKSASFGLDLTDTVFDEFRTKLIDLENEYKQKLKDLGIEVNINYNTSYNNQKLGEALGNKYPKLLKQCEAKLWDNIVQLYEDILRYQDEY